MNVRRAAVAALLALTTLGVGCTSSSDAPLPPAAPAGVRATAGDARVTVAWNAVAGATGYKVYHSMTPGGARAGSSLTASATATSADVAPLANLTPYYFVVTALAEGGESASSSEVTATPRAPAPPAPTGLTATPGNGQVTLAWNAVDAVGVTYVAYYSTTPGQGTAGTRLAAVAETTRVVTPLANGTPVYFVVAAVTPGGGEGPISSEVTATPRAPAPPAPTGLTATPGNGQVTLAWNAVDAVGVTYVAYYSTTPGQGTAGTRLAAVAETTRVVTPLANGTPVYFVVAAVTPGGGEGPISSEVSATPSQFPPAPANVAATPGDARVTLSWDASPGAIRYTAYVSLVPGAGKSGTPFTTNAPPLTVTGLQNGVRWYFVVAAVGLDGEGAASGEVSAIPVPPVPSAWSATVPVVPPAGSTLVLPAVAASSDGGAMVSWAERSGLAVTPLRATRYDPTMTTWSSPETVAAALEAGASFQEVGAAMSTGGRVALAAGKAVTSLHDVLFRYDLGAAGEMAASWSAAGVDLPAVAVGPFLPRAAFSHDGGVLMNAWLEPDPVNGVARVTSMAFRYAVCAYEFPRLPTCQPDPAAYGFDPEQTLEAQGAGSQGLSISGVGAGDVLAAWSRPDVTNGNLPTLYSARYAMAAGGGAWSAPSRVVPGATQAAYVPIHGQALVGTSTGSAVLAWGEVDAAGTGFSLWMSRLEAGAWTAAERVDVPDADPDVDLIGGFGPAPFDPPVSAGIDAAATVTVAWVQRTSAVSTPALHLRRCPASQPCGDPVVFSLGGARAVVGPPAIVVDAAGNASVIFRGTGPDEVLAVRYDAATAAWQATPTVLGTGAAPSLHAAVDGYGRVTVAWPDAASTTLFVKRFE